MDIRSILQDLREDRHRRRRDAPTGAFIPLGPKAWRKREKRLKERLDKEYDRKHRRALAQHRYYEKNKAKLNRIRILKARQPTGVYEKARRRAALKEQEWNFSFDEWWSIWANAPDVFDPDKGMKVEAWKLRGNDCSRNTQMVRRDKDGPWSTDNCYIGGPDGYRSDQQSGGGA